MESGIAISTVPEYKKDVNLGVLVSTPYSHIRFNGRSGFRHSPRMNRRVHCPSRRRSSQAPSCESLSLKRIESMRLPPVFSRQEIVDSVTTTVPSLPLDGAGRKRQFYFGLSLEHEWIRVSALPQGDRSLQEGRWRNSFA
jgi:hypothetical protein